MASDDGGENRRTTGMIGNSITMTRNRPRSKTNTSNKHTMTNKTTMTNTIQKNLKGLGYGG
jgi:hypothetical protein